MGNDALIDEIWRRLLNIQNFNFQAQSQADSKMNWHSLATGNAQISASEQEIIMQEALLFADGRKVNDVKIWHKNGAQLDFYRQYLGQKLFVYSLKQQGNQLISFDAHYCRDDVYHGRMFINPDNNLILEIYIFGPRKNEFLKYEYFSA